MDFQHLNTATDWPTDPIGLFQEWFDFVKADESVPEPEAMTLCSATRDGRPSARLVLLRQLDHGFCFFTNYDSRKGGEFIDNPHAALVFYWRKPYLQVRVEGRVEKVTVEESDAYFHSRARAKQMSTLTSQQSRPIESWDALRAAADSKMDSDTPVKRPDNWGGFRVLPERFEFWAGSPDRLHRRCEYLQDGDEWKRTLLAP